MLFFDGINEFSAFSVGVVKRLVKRSEKVVRCFSYKRFLKAQEHFLVCFSCQACQHRKCAGNVGLRDFYNWKKGKSVYGKEQFLLTFTN